MARRGLTTFHIGDCPWNPHQYSVERRIGELFTSLILIVFLGFKNSQTTEGVNNTPAEAGVDLKFKFGDFRRGKRR
jgi:hypothetical protein